MAKILAATFLTVFVSSCGGGQKADPTTSPPVGNTGPTGPAAPAAPQHAMTVSPGGCDAAVICGTVLDKQVQQVVAGATVVATSPALQGSVAAITDENGRYELRDLPPGEYKISIYYGDVVVEQDGVQVASRVDATVDTSATGEVILIQGE